MGERERRLSRQPSSAGQGVDAAPLQAYGVRDGEWKEDSVRGEDSRRTRSRGPLGRIAERRKLKRQRKLERKAQQQEHAREPLSGSGGLG
jgi:hypothetical protein